MEPYDFPAVTQWAIPLFILAIAIQNGLVPTGRDGGPFAMHDTLTGLAMGTAVVSPGLTLRARGTGLPEAGGDAASPEPAG